MQPQPTDPTQAPAPQPTPEDTLQATNKALMIKQKQNLTNLQQNTFSPAQVSQAMATLNPDTYTASVPVIGLCANV